MYARFGPAGNSVSFYEQGYKKSLEMPRWLKKMGLSAYEYQCTRGVNIKESTARLLGVEAEQNGIILSIHAPYYISLSTPEPDKQKKTKEHLLKTMYAAKWMGAKRVVFHPGGTYGIERGEALARAVDLLSEIIFDFEREGLNDILLAPETMGKAGQLGSLHEIIELCKVGSCVIPTIDFAHLHALEGGSFIARENFAFVLDLLAEKLPSQVVQNLHIHFSPIEYTKKGEKKHRNLLDEGFGPPFEPLAELIVERNISPTIICESADRQAEDALLYKEIYLRVKNNNS